MGTKTLLQRKFYWQLLHVGFLLSVVSMLEATTTLTRLDSVKVLKSLLNQSDLDLRPGVDGPAVLVRCGFYIVSFGPFSDVNMDYQLDIFLRQTWVDPRLKFHPVGDADHVLVSAEGMETFWKPDVFFLNGKKTAFHYVTLPNKLMRVYHNGTVLYSTRITLTLACKMDLRRFPLDHQWCSVDIESYAYETKDMQLEWDDVDEVTHENDLHLPQFLLVSKKTTKTKGSYKTGSFPRLTVTFELERIFSFFILQTYVPTILIVILAWVSFWVNMDSAPARVSLGVTTVLTMAAQLSGSKASIPKVHYTKAIDVWMTVCMMFVFIALVEYAFVNSLLRGKSENDKKKECEHNEQKSAGECVFQSSTHVFEPRLKSPPMFTFTTGRETAHFLDRVGQICFPIAFVIFNIVYWSVYTRPYDK